MLRYHLKLAIRTLLRNKLNSIINIFGLATGMAAVILIFIYVQHELSYDRFNQKHERIYRLISMTNDAGTELVPEPICLRLTQNNFASKLPEIEELTQLLRGWSQNVKVGNKNFTSIACQYVDTNFHKVFTLSSISGKTTELFSDPSGIVINASTAMKLFNTTDAAGKEVEMFDKTLTISAVVKDLPQTSHYDFDVLLPFSGFKEEALHKSMEYLTYILLKEGVDIPKALKKVEQLYTQMLTEAFGPWGEKTGSYLQKLTDIHLKSDYYTYLKPGGNIQTIYIHILLAFLILLIAIINFINIMTAQYEGKFRDIGMQKAIGANRIELIRQFLGNSMLMAFSSLLLGIILAEILLPYFSHLMARKLEIDYIHNPAMLGGLPFMALLVGILSGIYPAFVITQQAPVAVMKGQIHHSKGTNLLTRVLVIFQFAVSMVLIASVVILQQQIHYMKNANLGFNAEQVIAINNLSKNQKQAYKSIKQELLKIPYISVVSGSDHLPGGGGSGQGFYLVGQSLEDSKNINEYRVKSDYFKTLGIQFREGRPFAEHSKADQASIILNETAAKSLGVEEPLGQEVWFHSKKHVIQGIVKDFHYASLHEKIAPLMFSDSWNLQFILIKINSKKISELLPRIMATMRKFDPERKNFHLLVDDVCRDQYQREERSQKLTTYSSILSIILALLGLYALTLFMMRKRTKEIGIRKVNGASILHISGLLLSKFSKWIVIAFAIACPITWWLMNNWLENFAYRIEIGILPFLIAGGVAFLFALITVGWQTWKAANRNPVEALRYE